jgi:hypothetical protein
MSGRKYVPPDHVEEAGRAAVASLRKPGPAGKDGAMARGELIHLAPRNEAEEFRAEIKVRKRLNRHGHRWDSDPADPSRQVEVCPDPVAHAEDMTAIGDVLKALGLVTVPEPATVVPVRRLAERPQITGEPTRQQREMHERIAAFAGHREAGLNELDAARAMGISVKTARKYAEAMGGAS